MTEKKARILLLANYLPDRQQSMQRFARLMADELGKRGYMVRVIRPGPFFLRINMRGALAKWLGYLDKYLVFPFDLLKHLRWADLVHVCDHSNAVYVPMFNRLPHVVTCHDLLAVRAGLGEETYCPQSPLGKLLQRWILYGLRQARMIVCDSEATRIDVRRLVHQLDDSHLRMVPLSFDYPFSILDAAESSRRLRSVKDLRVDQPYVLHVGVSHPRKNRDGVMRIFAKCKEQLSAQLVFAGEPLTEELYDLACKLAIDDRVIVVDTPDDAVLEALYNRAFAMLYPSKSEGFGWPIIEAQACGCPVIVSNCGPCPEVAGSGALVCRVEDEEGFAGALLTLQDAQTRKKVIELGFANLRCFDLDRMVTEYIRSYETMLAADSR